jgi:lysozyme family protein
MQSNFQRSLDAVLKSEGGNDDDPQDHGGRTSRGITQREYDAWRIEHHEPTGDVWQASQEEIADIYHDEYWNPFCDNFPIGVDYLYFDMAVNAGPHRAAVLLQRALGVTADGRIGPATRAAVQKASPAALIDNYTQQKIQFYRSLHQPRFLKGWLNRARDVRATAMSMVA